MSYKSVCEAVGAGESGGLVNREPQKVKGGKDKRQMGGKKVTLKARGGNQAS